MKEKRVTWGIPAALLAFAVVLGGCASAPTNSGGGGNNAAAAAKLAKDLNAIKAGSAKVSGGTVTLSDRVGLKKALTVPEGVTLDLTAEGAALELEDGAVLTVNGTVKTSGHGDHGKGWVEGSLRVGDGAAVINGSGTINLASKGRLLNIGGDRDRRRQLTLDGVMLAGLPDNDHSLVGIYENSALILKSGAITGNTRLSDTHASGGGVEVYKGTFTMESGAISGNSAQGKDGSSGGGVNIGEEAVFTMTGGEITGNSASGDIYSSGGGVDVWRGTFTMEGGAISGNSTNGKEGSEGGGVNIGKEAVFTMTGGEITGNSVSGDKYSASGGVRIDEAAVFTMSGGAITGNTAIAGTNARGGGVWVREKAVFTMSGGIISGNSVSSTTGGAYGGGVVVTGSTFIMTNGTIAGNRSAGKEWKNSNSGGVRVMLGAVFTMSGGEIT
ncbi:MAG: hypothetical protein LBT00_03635, partial [Spirochaetaceae bacterium]|nr:hypothetical protein [Spirochaetaceae bacterium]